MWKNAMRFRQSIQIFRTEWVRLSARLQWNVTHNDAIEADVGLRLRDAEQREESERGEKAHCYNIYFLPKYSTIQNMKKNMREHVEHQ